MMDINQICEITGLNRDPAKSMLAKHRIQGKRLELSTSQKQYFDVDEDRLREFMKLRNPDYVRETQNIALNALFGAFSGIDSRRIENE